MYESRHFQKNSSHVTYLRWNVACTSRHNSNPSSLVWRKTQTSLPRACHLKKCLPSPFWMFSFHSIMQPARHSSDLVLRPDYKLDTLEGKCVENKLKSWGEMARSIITLGLFIRFLMKTRWKRCLSDFWILCTLKYT